MVKFIPGTATVIAQSVSTAKSKKSINPVDQVLTFARRKFEACPIKRSEVKAELIKAGIGKYGVSDEQLYGELNNGISMMLESVKFVKDCEALELCPFIVAQHCVFAGMSYSIEILKKGLNSVFDTIYLKQMSEHIFPERVRGQVPESGKCPKVEGSQGRVERGSFTLTLSQNRA